MHDCVAPTGDLPQRGNRGVRRSLTLIRALRHADATAHAARGLSPVPAPAIRTEHSSAPELHPHEIVRRPRAGDLEVEGPLAPSLFGHDVLERLPALSVDQERRSGDHAFLVVAVGSGKRYGCRGLAAQQSQTLSSERGEALLWVPAFLIALCRDAHSRRGMTLDHGERLGKGAVMAFEPR